MGVIGAIRLPGRSAITERIRTRFNAVWMGLHRQHQVPGQHSETVAGMDAPLKGALQSRRVKQLKEPLD
jgi:hypothetical protein